MRKVLEDGQDGLRVVTSMNGYGKLRELAGSYGWFREVARLRKVEVTDDYRRLRQVTQD